jgi:hypothetical protein
LNLKKPKLQTELPRFTRRIIRNCLVSLGGSSGSELQIKAGMAAPSAIQKARKKKKSELFFFARFCLDIPAFICS